MSAAARVLVVTTRSKFPKGFGPGLRRRLDVGAECHVELLTAQPAEGPVEAVAVRSVDELTGQHPLGGLRRSRRTAATPQRALADACRTSGELHRHVAGFDLVVALEAAAVLGVWWLGQRVPGPPMLFRPASLRRYALMHGLDVPPHLEPDDEGEAPAREGAHDPAALLTEPVRLLIAPANHAGQAGAWARAVREHVPGASAMNLRVGVLKNPFPGDATVPSSTYAGDLEWRLRWRRQVMETFTHVIVEANRPVLGASAGSAADNVLDLQRAGKQVAMLSHGTDARIPSVHAANEPWHPYAAIEPRQLRTFEVQARLNVEAYRSFEGPVFVSTPGLRVFVPEARWLPNVVDVDSWHRDEEPMQRPVPVVAHVPSGPQKGSHLIDPVLERLAAAGHIEYRRVEGVRYAKMPELYGTADIVVEQFGIADYSAAACEAMAAGRVVVSRVADGVRAHVLEQTGLELPIAEANPETLEQVILDLIADRDRALDLAARGRHFVRTVHDGRRSAQVLEPWLLGAPQ